MGARLPGPRDAGIIESGVEGDKEPPCRPEPDSVIDVIHQIGFLRAWPCLVSDRFGPWLSAQRARLMNEIDHRAGRERSGIEHLYDMAPPMLQSAT
jgi:hypothetical protein